MLSDGPFVTCYEDDQTEKMRWVSHEEEIKNPYKILVGKSDDERAL